MFKTSQEFKFSIKHEERTYDFAGQLVFVAKELNSIGTVHTEEELASFGVMLNESIAVPEYWTLELLAENLFNHARTAFSNLHAVTLYIEQNPQRVTEYSKDVQQIGDIMELEEIA